MTAEVQAGPVLTRTASERITRENVGRLTLALEWQVESFTLGPHLTPIANVAVDGTHKIIALHCQRWSGLKRFEPSGFFTYDLTNGKLLHHTRVPTRLDMSGTERNADGRSFFDLEKRAVWYSTRLEGTDVLMKLDLDRDRPRIVAKGLELADQPCSGSAGIGV